MNIILPTLREERRKHTVHLDLSTNWKSIRNTIIRNRQKKGKAVFDNAGEKLKQAF